MINFATITRALAVQLESTQSVRDILKSDIVRGGYINVNPSLCPWLGVYRRKIDYSPRTLGPVESWDATPQINVIIQAVSYKSGDDCEDLLESYIEKIVDAIWADPTIGNTVDMITGFSVEYGYNETDLDSLYFQSAIITLDLEVLA